MQQSEAGVNQQATRALQVGWLAGILDGEGSFLLRVMASGRFRACIPAVEVSNFDPAMIETAGQILHDCGVGRFHGSTWRTHRQKTAYQLVVFGFRRVHALLDVIEPYLVAKRPQAVVLREYIERRFTLYGATAQRGYAGHGKTTYTDADFAYIEKLKEARRPNERTPVPLVWQGVKMRSDLFGDEQRRQK